MPVYDISETDLTLYRIVDPGGVIVGYATQPARAFDYHSTEIEGIDPAIDLIEQVKLHVFATHREAAAFQEGLILCGERSAKFSPVACQPLGWAVIRELHYPPNDGDDTTIRVIVYSHPPRVLVELRHGQVSVHADPDLATCVLDYDHDPDARAPAKFADLAEMNPR